MIREDKFEAALAALQSILIQAKCRAYESGDPTLGDLLNDAELLPEHLGAVDDRSQEFRDLLVSIAQTHPGLRHVLDTFDQSPVEA